MNDALHTLSGEDKNRFLGAVATLARQSDQESPHLDIVLGALTEVQKQETITFQGVIDTVFAQIEKNSEELWQAYQDEDSESPKKQTIWAQHWAISDFYQRHLQNFGDEIKTLFHAPNKWKRAPGILEIQALRPEGESAINKKYTSPYPALDGEDKERFLAALDGESADILNQLRAEPSIDPATIYSIAYASTAVQPEKQLATAQNLFAAYAQSPAVKAALSQTTASSETSRALARSERKTALRNAVNRQLGESRENLHNRKLSEVLPKGATKLSDEALGYTIHLLQTGRRKEEFWGPGNRIDSESILKACEAHFPANEYDDGYNRALNTAISSVLRTALDEANTKTHPAPAIKQVNREQFQNTVQNLAKQLKPGNKQAADRLLLAAALLARDEVIEADIKAAIGAVFDAEKNHFETAKDIAYEIANVTGTEFRRSLINGVDDHKQQALNQAIRAAEEADERLKAYNQTATITDKNTLLRLMSAAIDSPNSEAVRDIVKKLGGTPTLQTPAPATPENVLKDTATLSPAPAQAAEDRISTIKRAFGQAVNQNMVRLQSKDRLALSSFLGKINNFLNDPEGGSVRSIAQNFNPETGFDVKGILKTLPANASDAFTLAVTDALTTANTARKSQTPKSAPTIQTLENDGLS